MQQEASRSVSTEDLTELALNAAIVLDGEAQRQATDATNATVTDFLDVIEGIVDLGPARTSDKLVSDPRKVGVVNRAFRYLKYGQPSTVQELVANIRGISEGYRKGAASGAEISRLRDFCVALHKELVVHAYGTYEDTKKREHVTKNAAGLF